MANRHMTTQFNNSFVYFRLKPLSACVRLAIAGGVFMGSVSPVLAELPVASQVWATMGQATRQQIGNTLRIDQKDQNVILNWDKFNVGAHNKVEFHQPNSTSIALNRIFQDSPSKIFGKVTANGQIYLYNKNGFVFGEKSVVNVNTLVASTLNISDDALNKGLFLKTDGSVTQSLGAEEGKPETATKSDSFIRIDKGAQIKATRDASKNSNDPLIIVAAPTVENKGSITTDEFGQIILVASKDKVYLQPASEKSPFRGLLVEVDTGGKVSNVGNILARQGNVTMQGFSVNQGGRVTATTSVNVNGSIRLLARENHEIVSNTTLFAKNTVRDKDLGDGLGTEAKVTFEPGSVTEIVADKVLDAQGKLLPLDQQPKAIDLQSQKQSYLEVVANTVHMQGASGNKPGAAITAPGGKVNITAVGTDTLNNYLNEVTGAATLPSGLSSKDTGRIIIDKGASINVSGIKGVKAAMESNVADVSVQTFDLRDAPQQKKGVLQGQTIRVDVRKGSKIVDTTGATNSIQRGIDERLGTGGEINLSSSGDVIVNDGAVVDISGGSVDYQDGYISTTKLLTDYGRIVDIGDADPNEHYVSIFGVVTEVHEKWGVTKVWNILEQFGQGQFEKGYTQGKDAGAFNIQSPLAFMNGDLIAGSPSGRYQRQSAPFGGSFTFNAQDGSGSDEQLYYISTQNIRFQTDKNALTLNIGDTFPTHQLDDGQAIPDDLVLSTSLINKSGVQNVQIKTTGNMEIAEDASISIASGGSLSLDARNIDVKGDIYSAGGAINLATNEYQASADVPRDIALHDTAVLDVSGRWVNDFEQGLGATPIDPIIIDGGTVNLTSKGNLTLASGSNIKADGGGWLSLNNDLIEGKGGDIELAAGLGSGPKGLSSSMTLDGELSASGLSQGGALSLTSEKIIVASAGNSVEPSDIAPLVLTVKNGDFDLVKNSGFSKINLNSIADLTVQAGTNLKLLAQNRVLQNTYRDQPSGKSIDGFTDTEILPEHLRQHADLNLTGRLGVNIETGSKIIGDKESEISLSSKRGIYVDGLIDAPSGSINLTINADDGVIFHDATQALWLGSHAQLLAKGTTRMNPTDALGRRTGNVLNGGKVTLTAQRGYVINEEGSLIDVTGTQAELDVPVADKSTNTLQYQAKKIGSEGGHIAMTAAEGIVLDGSLYGKAGSETTRGGRLDVLMDRNKRLPGTPDVFTQNPTVINVRQSSRNVLDKSLHYGDALDNFSPNSSKGLGHLNGQAFVSSRSIKKGGFDDVRLTSLGLTNKMIGEVRFQGNVNLGVKERIEINARKIAWEAGQGKLAAKGGEVVLDTAYLKMGADTYFKDDLLDGAPKQGGGTFNTKNTQLIELIGKSRWDGFNEINLGSAHDIRSLGVYEPNSEQAALIPGTYVGSMTTAANLNLNAAQIYPATMTNFTFAVKNKGDNNGHITIRGRNTDKTPLSANGGLNFEAPVINQNGILKAPFGSINLHADKRINVGKASLTSVSADGQVVPFGITSGGLFWLYPVDVNGSLKQVYNSSPRFAPIQTKRVNFSSPKITLTKGSVVDVSGGGDLQSYEFIPGAGGSYDYLDPQSPSYQGGFAILPSLGSAIAPYDPSIQKASFTYKPGSSVYLSGTDHLPAGTYTIMPARYALLDGAFLVTPQANSQDKVFTSFTKDRLPIVAGYQTTAAIGTRDARWSGFRIEQGSDVRKHSQYNEYKANDFFVKQAVDKGLTTIPAIPKDSGQIVFDVLKKQHVTNKLVLEGSILSTPDKDINGLGKGGKLDISADSINVVENLNDTAVDDNSLKVLDSDLSGLNLDSLFLGGIRGTVRNSATGEIETTLNVKAQDVTFSSGVEVRAKDFLAGAKTKVEVKSGATLTVDGEVNTGDSILNLAGDGALLRASGDKQVILNRTNSKGLAGNLLIEAGAVVNGEPKSALQSVLLDASKSTQLDGDILMTGGSLSLNANAINIGEVKDLTGDATNFSNEQLSALKVDELQLNSRKSINFYGNVGQLEKDGLLSPLQFGSLIINAPGFSGFNNDGKTARLQADRLQVSNLFGAQDASIGNGHGRLDLITNNYTQGSGDFGINGFNTVNINVAHKDKVAQGFTADGESVLKVKGDLNLVTDYITGTGGANLKIDAQGHNVNISGNGFNANPDVANFGDSVSVVADKVDLNTTTYLPSGQLSLNALKGDIQVDDNANIDLAGQRIQFADVYEYTPGGTFSAIADKGKITLAKGSVLNLNPGGETIKGQFIPKEQGGNLILKAPGNSVAMLGQIGAAVGNANIDIAKFDPSAADFDQFMNVLKTVGISDSIYFHIRQDNIVQAAGNEIKANSITLVTDKGKMDLSGKLNVNGSKDGQEGGAIELYAGDKITLNNGSVLTATGGTDSNHAISGKGGKVWLESVDSDSDGNSGISIKAGSLIDASGNSPEQGGKVTLRALRTDKNNDGVDDNINIDKIEGTVKGKIIAEGVKKYSNDDIGNDGEINAADIAKIKADTDSYMAAAAANMQTILAGNLVLRPGVEIDYEGKLTLQKEWNFFGEQQIRAFDPNLDWHYNGVTGNLIINTSGDFIVNKSITDGFLQDYSADYSSTVDVLQPGDSWSYQLTAGSDLTSADKYDTLAETGSGSGNLLIGPKGKISIRTGTGDIKLAASGDIQFLNNKASVYISGKPEESNRYGSLDVNGYATTSFNAEYPVAGGDLFIKAGHGIIGASSSGQNSYKWLARMGDWAADAYLTYPDLYPSPTAWGVKFDDFNQNIGSFGGGKVEINAAGDINNLSVMMPTTGKQVGIPSKDGGGSPYALPKWDTNLVTVNGGGEMTIKAGGDIVDGTYLLGKGNGSISAGGEIKSNGENVNGHIVMGETNFSLTANQGITLSAVSDQMSISNDNLFYTYTATSGITVKSLSGDVNLGADTSAIYPEATESRGLKAAKVYPASVQTAAFGGSIAVNDLISLFPSAKSTLSLLAKQNISGKGASYSGIEMFDVDMSLVPTSLSPKPLVSGSKDDFTASFTDKARTPVPLLHKDDKEPARLVTLEGDIDAIKFISSKPAIVQAGRDLSNLNLDIQNINSDDVTHLSAGRDLTNSIDLYDSGSLIIYDTPIRISGPGDVLVKTGRNINLGVAAGLNTIGNKDNSNLSETGANITVLAGLNGNELDYSSFTNKYLQYYPVFIQYSADSPAVDHYKEVSALITDFMRKRLTDAELSEPAALKLFKSLKAEDYSSIQPQLNALIIPVYEKNSGLSYQGISNEEIITSLKDSSSAKYDSLIGKYLQHFAVAEKFNDVSNIVTGFMRQHLDNANLSPSDALKQFKELKADDYLSIEQQLNNAILPVYYNEINEAGSASASDAALGNDRGFTAINTLFPGSEYKTDDPLFPWKGDLNMIFSTIQTQLGGDINLLLPGGQVNVGLAVAFSGLTKKENELGIIALEEGSINAVIRDDFQVNQSRVFTQNGGDILIWSTEGDIDAGNGAKTALAIADTEILETTSGKITQVRPPVSGKGIRAVVPESVKNVSPGDVYLFAPGGVINAGEAGIECNNCTFSATAVLGANNVQIGGISTGVPVASVGSVAAGLSGVSNLSASVNQTAQSSADMSKDTDASNKKKVRGRLSVKVLRSGA